MPHDFDSDFPQAGAPRTQVTSGVESIPGLSATQKFGLQLEAFGAGMGGRQPAYQRILQQQAELEQKRIESYFKGHQLFKEKLDMMDSVVEEHKPEMSKIFASQIEQLLPGGGASFMAMVNAGPDVYNTVLDLLGSPEAAATASRVYQGNTKAFLEDIRKPEFLKNALALHDQKTLPGVIDKLRAIRSQSLDLPEELAGRVQASMTRDGFFQMDSRLLQDVNMFLRAKGDKNALSDSEFRTMLRNPSEFIPLGIIPVETTAAAQKEQLLKEEQLVGTNAAGQLIVRNKLTGALSAVGSPPNVGASQVVTVQPPGPQGLDPNKIIERYGSDRGVRRFVFMKEGVNTIQQAYGTRVGNKLVLSYEKGNAAIDKAAALLYLQVMTPEWEDIKEDQAEAKIRSMGNIPSGIATSIMNTLRGERLNKDVFNEIVPFIFARFKVANEEQKRRELQFQSQMTRAPGGDPSDIEVFSQGKPLSFAPPKVPGVPTAEDPGFQSYVLQYAADAKEQGFDVNQIDSKVKKHFGDAGVKLLRQQREMANPKNQKRMPVGVSRDRSGQPIPLIRPTNPRQRGFYGFEE